MNIGVEKDGRKIVVLPNYTKGQKVFFADVDTETREYRIYTTKIKSMDINIFCTDAPYNGRIKYYFENGDSRDEDEVFFSESDIKEHLRDIIDCIAVEEA